MAHLISIGNSQGIRIPKSLIQQAGLDNSELKLQIVPEGLLIIPLHSPRQGWAEACETASQAQDKILIDNIPNQFDEEEWEW